MCFGEGTIAGHVVSPPFSSRGVLKWHSLLKVHLAIDESTSARVQLKWENALLARFRTPKVQVTPSEKEKKSTSSQSLIGWCIVYDNLVLGVAIGGGSGSSCIVRTIDCVVMVGHTFKFRLWASLVQNGAAV